MGRVLPASRSLLCTLVRSRACATRAGRSAQIGLRVRADLVRAAASGSVRAFADCVLCRWTTDVELEALLTRFGRVESIKFVEDKNNGKSKARVAAVARTGTGWPQGWAAHSSQTAQGSATVEFATPEAAAACKVRVFFARAGRARCVELTHAHDTHRRGLRGTRCTASSRW